MLKKAFVSIFLLMFLYGCSKPYALLDDKKKIAKTFQKYITDLQDGKYDEAYKLLYFGHVPNGGNKKLYVQAQKIVDKLCTAVNYEADAPVVKNDIAVMDLDMIFNYKNGNKIKKKTQVFFVKVGKDWKIAIGDYKNRMRILRIYPQFKSMPLKKDRTFILKNGVWQELKPIIKKQATLKKDNKNTPNTK